MTLAPIIGFLSTGCGSSNDTFPGLGGSGGDGGTSAGTGGSAQGGSGGTSAGTGAGGSGGGAAGAGGSGGTGASSGGSSNTGGAGGASPSFDYEPFGVGDPWFFSSDAELEAFTVELTGATGTASWSEPGEVHLPLAFSAAGDQALIHFTAPWDAVSSQLSPMDLRHRVMRARVRVASGATATGGVQGFSQSSTGWTWVNGSWNSIGDLGAWHEVEFDFDTAAFPSDVMRFGLQVYATGAGNAEIVIDDLRLEPKPVEPGPDGGVPQSDAGVPEGDAGGELPIDGDAGAPDAGGGGGLGYEPVGIGDPWFFDAEPEMTSFTFGVGGGASESHSWSSGAVHVSATFAASGDTVAMHITTPWNGTTNTADLTGRVIRARVRLASGATADGGVQVFVQSGGWSYVSGDWNGASGLGAFTDVTFPLTSATNAASVQRFGMQFYATSAGSIELIVDDIRIEPAI